MKGRSVRANRRRQSFASMIAAGAGEHKSVAGRARERLGTSRLAVG